MNETSSSYLQAYRKVIHAATTTIPSKKKTNGKPYALFTKTYCTFRVGNYEYEQSQQMKRTGYGDRMTKHQNTTRLRIRYTGPYRSQAM